MTALTEPTAEPIKVASPYSLFDFNRAVITAPDLKDVYDAALHCLCDSLGVHKTSILLFDDAAVMRFVAWTELSPAYRAAVEGHTPWTPETRDPQPVLVTDVREEASLDHLLPAIEAEGILSLAFFPLVAEERLLGKFMLYYPEPHDFSREEIILAQTIAAHVGFAIDRFGQRTQRREEREQIQAMLNSTVLGIAELDASARFKMVNDRFCEIVGRSREELLGLETYAITHPDDLDQTRIWLSALISGANNYTVEKRYLKPDGEVVWVSISVTAMHDEHGGFQSGISAVTDVTRRKLGEERMRESERRYADLISSVGLAVYTTDAEGYITFYNQAAVDLWGREPVLGAEQWCGSFRMATPEGEPIRHDSCPMAIALKEDRPVRGVELVAERPDGSSALVLPYPTPMHDAAGKLTGAVNVVVDITDRKRAETELAERNQLIESMTDNMSVGLLLLDEDGRIEFMNPSAERVTGYEFADVCGRELHESFHHSRPDGTPYPGEDCPIDSSYRSGGRLLGHEDVFIKPDGALYNIVLNVTPLISHGQRRGAVLDLRDTTIQKRAEAALRESEESMRETAALKDQFLGLVSHELRTPISTILGNALLLKRRGDRLTDEDKEQSLADIASEADKLQEIIENLLLITRLEAGTLDIEPLALQPIVQEAITDFRKLHPEREVRLDSPERLPPGMGDSTLVTLVLRNLLSNADKYTPDKEAAIDVRLRHDGAGQMEVCVQDHGIGLDARDLERAFSPFFRSQRSKNLAKGMGLGLAVCKRVIEAQGGSIWIESTPGEGSSFFFTLQLAALVVGE